MTGEAEGFDIGTPIRRHFVMPLRHPVIEMPLRAQPPLKRLHESVYQQSRVAARSLEYHRRKCTEEIVESLRPGVCSP